MPLLKNDSKTTAKIELLLFFSLYRTLLGYEIPITINKKRLLTSRHATRHFGAFRTTRLCILPKEQKKLARRIATQKIRLLYKTLMHDPVS
ncbi:hypothetical protein Chls_011 [Chlamydia suis]|uniref:Uncharacterized protein n=1 Tax=Chlamydia suis TaxID=83559 RepID=A0ABX6IRZ4_9CHLA|nr:hypothetical protein Chls_011 [Chlamydia suis]